MVNQTNIFEENENETVKAANALEYARLAHQRYIIKHQNEDSLKAIEGYIEATKYNPKLPESYYRLAILMWEKGEISLEEAIAQCDTALSFAPDNFNARVYKGYFEKLLSDYNSAEEEFKKAINLSFFDSARPRLLLALSILKRMNKEKASFKDFSKFCYYFATGSLMISLDKASLNMLYHSFKDDLVVYSYNAVGSVLERLRICSLALNLYENATKTTGHKEIFYSKMADLSLKSQNFELALTCYKKALEANPKNKGVLMKLATLTQTYFPDMINESIDYYTAMLEAGSTNVSLIYYELGHLYLKKKDKINSISAFKLAIEQDKCNPFYHNSLAYAYLQAELYDDAVIHYNMAISMNPDKEWTAIVCHVLGTTYAEVYGDLNSAITKFSEGISLDPKNYELHISLGDAQMANNDTDGAIKSYCEAINLDGNNYRGYSKIGMALWEKDFIEESVVAYHKSIDLNPNFDIAQNNLGVIYLDTLECAKESLEYFENAININPKYTLAYFNAGRASQAIGNKTEAAEYYQMAIDINNQTHEMDEAEIKEKLHSLFEL